MNVKKVAADQPEFFQFSDKNLNRAKKIIKKVLDTHKLRSKYQLDLFQEV